MTVIPAPNLVVNAMKSCRTHPTLQIVCLYEVFRDEAAFRQHLTYDYYKEWMENSRNWRHSENRIRHVLDYVYGPEDGEG